MQNPDGQQQLTYLVHSRERGLGNILVVDLPHLCHVGEAVGAYGAEVVAGADKLVEAGLADEKKLSMYLMKEISIL